MAVGLRTVTYWEFRRLWNYLRKAISRPVFIAVQVVAFGLIGIIVWLLTILIFWSPLELRGPLYQILVQTGFLGSNAVVLIYAIISLLVVQQIFKGVMGVPLKEESIPADVDILIPAPIPGRVYLLAKYFSSIPRRLMFFMYAFLALTPVLAFFMVEYVITPITVITFLVLVLLLAEIGSLLAHGLYCLRKLAGQNRPRRRLYQLGFYLSVVVGSFLFLFPVLFVGNIMIYLPLFNLAFLLVALISQGQFVQLFLPALFGAYLGLLILYPVSIIVVGKLADRITIDMYEDISVVTRKRGVELGLLSRLPIKFQGAQTPFRALWKKDVIMGLRGPGKAFYWGGILANFFFSILFVALAPTIHELIPLPSEYISIIPVLYAILLVLLIPLLAITASDPFRGEYGSLYILRLAPLAPLHVTLVKFSLLIITPTMLSIPFAIYFAVILGDLQFLPIAVAILPHAIVLSTAMGLSLGSRYPYATKNQTQTPVALMITYPVLSWIVIFPVVLFQIGFLQEQLLLLFFSSLLILPYTIGLTLILLSWAAHSYIRQE